jgi:LPS sulfotransferase NodH
MPTRFQKGQSFIGMDSERRKFRAQELANYRDSFFKPMPLDQVRLLIFGQGRTGSTLLESLLVSTGHFRRNGELLNPAKGEVLFPIRYIRGISNGETDENFLFHLKIYHLTRDRKRPVDPTQFLGSLSEDGWKFVYLRRRNTVQHQLSNAVREHRGSPHKFDDDAAQYRIRIDCESFVERVFERIRFEEAEREALADVDYCEVIYEDHLESANLHQDTIDRIVDYSSLERRPVATKHRKVNTQDLDDLIVNYDEFVECLKKNNLERFL